jgi:hypothetical protein
MPNARVLILTPGRTALLALVVLLLAAGSATAGTLFSFPLSGDQAVPPVAAATSGECLALLDDLETTLLVSCVHDIAAGSVTAAHIHAAPAGSNGGVRLAFSSAVSPIEQSFAVTLADVADLVAGNLYVNVHTTTNPGGELRGQMVGAPRTSFTFTLAGDQEVPAAATEASGACEAYLNSTRSLLAVACTHDVASPTAAHLHSAAAGVNGPVVFPFASGTSPIVDIWAIDAVNADLLEDQGLYFNVHSSPFPGGEIRGQVEIGVLNDGFESGAADLWSASFP